MWAIMAMVTAVIELQDDPSAVGGSSTAFENFVNPASIIWQDVETDYWKKFLKESLNTFVKETNSKIAQKILNDFENELKKFKQICPIEMLDKLDNPISLRSHTKKAG